eukprot:764796-Hanusia_phi.AAC.4
MSSWPSAGEADMSATDVLRQKSTRNRSRKFECLPRIFAGRAVGREIVSSALLAATMPLRIELLLLLSFASPSPSLPFFFSSPLLLLLTCQLLFALFLPPVPLAASRHDAAAGR